MCVSVDYQTVAWNPSGIAAIVHERSYGPEGGGSDGYRILDFNGGKNEIYIFSSDFSPGDGSTPQSISKGECGDAAVKANNLLGNLGFKSRFKESCLLGRANMLSSTDAPPQELTPDKITEMEKALSLTTANTVSTKDNIHFVVTSKDPGCRSICKWVVFDTTNKLYKELGECRSAAN
jgi:hypothetical protein